MGGPTSAGDGSRPPHHRQEANRPGARNRGERPHRPSARGLAARLATALVPGLGLCALLAFTLALSAPLPFARATPVEATMFRGPAQLGTTFSPRRAADAGVDYRAGFRTLLTMGFKVIRLSAYWSDIRQDGYSDLDWLMDEARGMGQPVVLTVGIKGVGWPEFYVPDDVFTRRPMEGQDVALDFGMRAEALRFIEATVRRYQEYPNLVAWQVENEPLNRTGPHRWWIDREFLRQEVQRVTALDAKRPIIVNAFGHFNLLLDRTSSAYLFDLATLLGFDNRSAEREILALLRPGDVLGFDVYLKIGYQFLGSDHFVEAAADWAAQIGRWRAVAAAERKHVWITEAQAEPWQVSPDSRPTFTPARMEALVNDLKGEGYSTILLWGAEHWLARLQAGDPSWMQAAQRLLERERAIRAEPPSLMR